MANLVLNVKSVKGNKNIFVIDTTDKVKEHKEKIKKEIVKQEKEIKEKTVKENNSSVVYSELELEKEKNDIELMLVNKSSDKEIYAIRLEIEKSILNILTKIDFMFDKTILNDYTKLNDYVMTNRDNKYFTQIELIIAFYLGYKKAIKGNKAIKTKDVKFVINGDKNIYIDSIKKDYRDNQKYIYTNSTDVKNFTKKENNYKEIYSKLDGILPSDRMTLNTFNECYMRFLKHIDKIKIAPTYDKKNRLNLLQFNNETENNNKKIQFLRLVTTISLLCVDGIVKAHFEGLKGNKKRNEIQIFSLDASTDGENNFIDLLEDELFSVENFTTKYNLKVLLSDEEYSIIQNLALGYTQREIKEKLTIHNRKITQAKEHLYSIIFNGTK